MPEFGQPIGMTRYELLHRMQVEPADLAHSIADHMRLELPFRDLEYSFERADGTRHWVRLSGKPARDAAGRVSGYRGSARDVTKIREAAHRPLERQARYESIFANAIERSYRNSLDGT